MGLGKAVGPSQGAFGGKRRKSIWDETKASKDGGWAADTGASGAPPIKTPRGFASPVLAQSEEPFPGIAFEKVEPLSEIVDLEMIGADVLGQLVPREWRRY
jgi:hypothetical protein